MKTFLTKLVRSGRRRIHLAVPATSNLQPATSVRPACGGGHGARSVQWQTDIGPCDCAACQSIAQKKGGR